MLGWEFPPFLTGGLGKASYGLAQALSEYVDLTLVVPQSVPGSFQEKWRTIGLHEVNLLHHDTNQMLPVRISYVNADLDPYTADHFIQQLPQYSLDFLLEQFIHQLEALSPRLNPNQRQELYGTPNNYGSHLLTKVADYTEAVLELAQSIPFDVIHAHDWMTFPAALQIKHVHSLETDRRGADGVNPAKTWLFGLNRKPWNGLMPSLS